MTDIPINNISCHPTFYMLFIVYLYGKNTLLVLFKISMHKVQTECHTVKNVQGNYKNSGVTYAIWKELFPYTYTRYTSGLKISCGRKHF